MARPEPQLAVQVVPRVQQDPKQAERAGAVGLAETHPLEWLVPVAAPRLAETAAQLGAAVQSALAELPPQVVGLVLTAGSAQVGYSELGAQ